MKRKLTLRVDEAAILRAKRFAESQGKSVSQMVEDYFRIAEIPHGDGDLPAIHPDVLALSGILASSGLDESSYRDYLIEKHR